MGHQLLIVVVSFVPWHVKSSWTRDQTYVPGTGRWILHHWATREAQQRSLMFYFLWPKKKIEHKSWNWFQKLNFGQPFCSWCSCCWLFLPPPYHPAEGMLRKDGENISLLLPPLEWGSSSWRDRSGSFDTVKGVVCLVDFANWGLHGVKSSFSSDDKWKDFYNWVVKLSRFVMGA